MKLMKKELIISVIMMIAFLIVGFNLAVLATSNDDGSQNIIFPPANNNLNNNLIIIAPNNNTNLDNENTGNSLNIPIKDGEVENTNTPTEVPDTGLEDLPWLIIGVCIVSAIFAYKKIKEYKEN